MDHLTYLLGQNLVFLFLLFFCYHFWCFPDVMTLKIGKSKLSVWILRLCPYALHPMRNKRSPLRLRL